MRKRSVIQYTEQMELVARFPSVREAQEKYHITHVSGVCRGQRLTDGGYVWRYADEVEGREMARRLGNERAFAGRTRKRRGAKPETDEAREGRQGMRPLE